MAGTGVRFGCASGRLSERFSLQFTELIAIKDKAIKQAIRRSSQQFLGRGIDVGTTRNNARFHD